MLVISLLIPEWVILDANLNQMAALMNNMPVEIQQHYKVSNLNKYKTLYTGISSVSDPT